MHAAGQCWLLYDLSAACPTPVHGFLTILATPVRVTAHRVTDGMHTMWKHREANNARIEPSLRGAPDVVK